jgi:hypothetical protein
LRGVGGLGFPAVYGASEEPGKVRAAQDVIRRTELRDVPAALGVIEIVDDRDPALGPDLNDLLARTSPAVVVVGLQQSQPYGVFPDDPHRVGCRGRAMDTQPDVGERLAEHSRSVG